MYCGLVARPHTRTSSRWHVGPYRSVNEAWVCPRDAEDLPEQTHEEIGDMFQKTFNYWTVKEGLWMEIQPVVLLVMFEMTSTNVSSVNDRNICNYFVTILIIMDWCQVGILLRYLVDFKWHSIKCHRWN